MSADDAKLLDYITLHHTTHLNYHHANVRPEDLETLIPLAIRSVQNPPSFVLKVGKDPKSILELGIRYLFLFYDPCGIKSRICTGNGRDTVHLWTNLGQLRGGHSSRLTERMFRSL